ncbi:MAG: DNA recombination protein RmuC [Eubacteriales bacterium]|nr:DNA recombination protein RmuC [Eubacteriales bacterium]
MDSLGYVIIALLSLLIICVLVLIVLVITGRNKGASSDEIAQRVREEVRAETSALRQEINGNIQSSVKNMGEMVASSQRDSAQNQNERLLSLEERLKTFSLENEQKMDAMRKTVETRLTYMQEDNNRRLEQVRHTVDEKLQKTLDEKMAQSFLTVNESLEKVYKSLGEMQTLATGVGDLKKVLSNVKTRGILGEIQLGSILREILAPEQFEENTVTKKGSAERVEFAVKLPAEDEGFIYLPIDSKFPGDTYAQLQDAMESGVKENVDLAAKNLLATLKKEAKDIHDKYIDPPNTTEFAVMFLPTEGLYAEAVNRGMVEILQRDYKVNIAGPSTMAALLNSLQMGFKTLAVQKRSAEVWKVLGSVKTEFNNFNKVLESTQQRLNQANNELDKLVGVRTRQILRKLSSVEANTLPIEDTDIELLPESEN